jgi:hypothetical protein
MHTICKLPVAIEIIVWSAKHDPDSPGNGRCVRSKSTTGPGMSASPHDPYG